MTIDLTALNGITGFRLDGTNADDLAGISISSAGDVNGDGFDDLIVGAHATDFNGNLTGSAYVVFGKMGSFGTSLDLSALNGQTGFRLDGAAAVDVAGYDVSSAGDVNGDGYDDIVVGAFLTDNGSLDPSFNAGTAYVVYGKASGFNAVQQLSNLSGANGFRIEGEDFRNYAGFSVSSAGDINNDGFDDVLVGASQAASNGTNKTGAAYVVFGKAASFGPVVKLSALTGANGFKLSGETYGNLAGFSVSKAGDVNGDGFDDVIVGAYAVAQGGVSNSGRSYVVFGKAGAFASNINLSALNGTNGFKIGGEAGSLSGRSVSAAGDVNGDGIDDLIVGASFAETGNAPGGEGAAYVVFGKTGAHPATLQLSALNGTNGFRLEGFGTNQQVGTSVANAGDINGDGFADVIIGAPAFGAAYVVFGKAGGFASSIDLGEIKAREGFQIVGASFDDKTGFSVTGLGDFNNDGFDDFAVGAHNADPDGLNNAGAGYVIYGRPALTLAAEVKLAQLDSKEGLRLVGAKALDRSGYSVSDAGDVNGDGIGDLVVGAPGVIFPNKSACYVVFGRATGFPLNVQLSALNGSTGFRINGEATGDKTGSAVSSAGDVNGDGIADLLVGAPGTTDTDDPNGTPGSSYVIFGKQTPFASALNLSSLDGTTGFQLTGAAVGDYAGVAVASGDINGDGRDDLIAGAANTGNSGAAFVVFGKAAAFASNIQLSTLNGTNGFRLTGASGDFAGIAVASAGDVNGDGREDLLIGASGATSAGGSQQGAAYLVFGKAGGFAANLNLASLNGTTGYRFRGTATQDYLGFEVAGGGDIDGDGFDDFILGASDADRNGNGSGSAYIVFGGAANLAALDLADGTANGRIAVTALNGTRGFRIDGEAAYDFFGYSAAGAGDFNGDGFDDIIIGAKSGDISVGTAYLIYGKPGGFTATLDLERLDGVNGFKIAGGTVGGEAGTAVSFAGDINKDGFDDVIVGAPGGGTDPGESFILYGLKPTFAVTRTGSAADQTIRGGDFGDRLSGAGGDDRLLGGGGNDTLNGGVGADTMTGGLGNDNYTVDNAGDRIVETAAGGTDTVVAHIAFTLVGLQVENLTLAGTGAIDATGNVFNNAITGNTGNNVLRGGNGNDIVTGGTGADQLFGGAGKDTFVFSALGNSGITAPSRDSVGDFLAGDKLDVESIDAKQTAAGNQVFVLDAGGAFVAGEIRIGDSGANLLVSLNTDADAAAEMQFMVLNRTVLTASDFIL